MLILERVRELVREDFPSEAGLTGDVDAVGVHAGRVDARGLRPRSGQGRDVVLSVHQAEGDVRLDHLRECERESWR